MKRVLHRGVGGDVCRSWVRRRARILAKGEDHRSALGLDLCSKLHRAIASHVGQVELHNARGNQPRFDLKSVASSLARLPRRPGKGCGRLDESQHGANRHDHIGSAAPSHQAPDFISDHSLSSPARVLSLDPNARKPAGRLNPSGGCQSRTALNEPSSVSCASPGQSRDGGGGGAFLGRPRSHALISERPKNVPLGTARQRLPNLSSFRIPRCRQAAFGRLKLSADFHVCGLLSAPFRPGLHQ